MNPALPQIGRYTTLSVLGAGGMGTVYLARHPELGFELAIKVLLSGRGASDAQRRRFQREARALRQLDHPGLVKVVDAGEQDGVPWFAMRRVAGESLEERLRTRGPLSNDEATNLGVQLCAALSAAHAIGVLHRDLKPDNVLITPEGRYVVTDFGLVKELGREESVRLSKTGTLQGTPGYWAPEQAAGQAGKAAASVDVYGVGAVLYAALTGLPPIRGEGLLELVVATLELAPTPPSALVAVSARLERIVLRCLEKSPDARFESLGPLGIALADLEGHGQRAPGGGSGGSLALWIAGGVLLGLALVGGSVAWALRHPVPPPAPSASPSLSPQAISPTPARSSSPTPTSRSPLAAAPAWYRALPEGERPPLPLAPGLRFGVRPREYVNRSDRSVLVFVPAGSFAMGRDAGQEDQKPVRVVTFTTGFFLGKHETTWRQYQAFCDATGRTKRSRVIDLRKQGGSRVEAGDEHPAFNVSWDDAVAYCRWAGLRLPSEAEWEYSARGTESTTWPWGEEKPSPARLNVADQSADWDFPAKQKRDYGLAKEVWRDGFAYTAPVGSFPEGGSPFGCSDLAGNVCEWVQDAYVNTYEGAPRDGSARDSAGGASWRVYRGGSWLVGVAVCHSAYRFKGGPAFRVNYLGFRPARSLR